MQYKANPLRAAIAAALALAALVLAPAAFAQQRVFDIPSTDASSSLPEYGRQAGLQIIAPSDHLAGVRTPAIKGEMDVHAALKLLLAGTGLKVIADDGRTITLGTGPAAAGAEHRPPGSAAVGAPAPPAIDAPRAEAPPASPQAAKSMTAVIVTGTHADNRTESSSLAPIDVVSAKTLASMGTNNVGVALARLIPSLNFPASPVATDATDTQRPAQLRGLSPDQVLVLVNGKRWHTAAMVNTGSALGRGSAPVDLDSIPMAAIDHIEVLRDGASAEYGSDAIAGVINIILKHGGSGGEAELDGGRYQRGGGRQWQGSSNFGIPINGDRGWLRLTLDRGHQDATDHGGVDVRYPELGHRQGVGNPAVGDGSVFLNAGYDFSKAVQFYAFGSYHRRDSTSFELYRGPFSYAAGAPILSIYPEGYQPLLHMRSSDRSLVAGFRGETGGGWRWDVSANYGANAVALSTLHTANLALLQDTGATPTSFHDGKVTSGMQAVDVDIAKDVSLSWLPNPVTVAFGAEYLRNTYKIVAGNPDSYYVGGSGQPGGAQSFNGFQPVSAGSWSRSDVAEYLSLETNLTDRLGVSLAGRHEDYNDFGNTTSASLSGRFDFTDRIALRGSASTGFRAPSLAQQYYSQVGSIYLTPSSAGPGIAPGIYQSGLLQVNSQVAQLLGAEALKPEKSHNYTLGLVLNPLDPLTITLDVYQISIDNRIVLSGNLSGLNAPSIVDYFAANGVGNVNYSTASFFTNAVDTRTRGADLVANYHFDFGSAGTLNSTLSYNYNRNKVTRVAPNPAMLDQLGLNLQRVSYRDIKGLLADSTPRSKLIFGENWAVGRWTFNADLTRYGRFTAYSNAGYQLNQVFSPQWVLDLAASYDVDDWTFTVGSDNLTNSYPDKVIAANNSNGTSPYSMYSPDGYNGRYFYTRATYHW